MTISSFTKRAVTHTVALLLGFGAAALFVEPGGHAADSGPGGRVARTRLMMRPVSGGHLSSGAEFRQTYEELAVRSMTASERRRLKKCLLDEWAERNPVELLAFLRTKRMWPYNYRIDDFISDGGLESSSLTLERPDLLLDFAIHDGCHQALSMLYHAFRTNGKGDPDRVIRLIDSLPQAQKGREILWVAKEISQTMGRNGVGITNPNAAYLRGVAEGQLYDEGRLDEFFATFEKIDDASTKKSLAQDLGYTLSHEQPDDKALEQIMRLPLDYRTTAVAGMFLCSADDSMRFPEIRDERRQWIGKLVEQGLGEGAKDGVRALCDVSDDPRAHHELAAWVQTIPLDDSWKPVAEELCRWWLYRDRDAMVREVCAMPEGPARDMLAAHAVADMQMRMDSEEQAIFARLVGLITDPAIRKRFEKDQESDE